jgi:hypothetical protein
MKAIPKTEINGSPISAAGNEGTGTACIESDSEYFKPCPHRYCGCISQNGYLCLHNGPCEPIDERGRWFAISYTMEHGQMFMHREYRPMPVAVNGNKAVCGNRCMCQPEDHAGKGACGKAVLGSFSPKTNPADVIAS